jgi:preprotein translocase subunit SecD
MKFVIPLLSLLFVVSSLRAAEPAMEMRLVVTEDTKGAIARELQGETLWLDHEVAFSSADVQDAYAVTQRGMWLIVLKFTEAGGVKFGKFTGAHVGSRLAILGEGKLLSAPNLREAITGGSAEISGNFSETAARNLASAIKTESSKAK